MPTLPKRKKTKSAKPKANSIDSAQRELLEQQSRIEAEIKALQASLEQAPQRVAEQRRRDRETFLNSPTRGRYVHGATLTETRRPVPKRPTMLRAERIAARRQTMALIVCLAVAVMYALSHFLT